METKNNSDFISKVDAFSEEMEGLINNSNEKRAVIIIASEPNVDKASSRQTGAAFGNEDELVMAIAGFIKHPQMLTLLKKAAMIAEIAAVSDLSDELKKIPNESEQEESK